MERTNKPRGTSLASVTMVLMPAASFTPRSTSAVSTHRKMLAHTMDSTLFPAPNAGKKYPSALNSSRAKLTLDRQALIQYPQAELKPTYSPNPAAA